MAYVYIYNVKENLNMYEENLKEFKKLNACERKMTSIIIEIWSIDIIKEEYYKGYNLTKDYTGMLIENFKI